MKHKALSMIVFVSAAVAAFAQETPAIPKAEVGLNYSAATIYPGAGAPSFTSQGGSGTFVYNVNRYFGAVADLGGYHNTGDVNFTPTTFTYLFGPRLSLRKSRVTPYVQALFGGARVGSNFIDPNTGNALTQNGFTSAYGGGMDVRVSQHFAVKPFQIEYVRAEIPNLTTFNGGQNDIRYSAGVVFHLGAK